MEYKVNVTKGNKITKMKRKVDEGQEVLVIKHLVYCTIKQLNCSYPMSSYTGSGMRVSFS